MLARWLLLFSLGSMCCFSVRAESKPGNDLTLEGEYLYKVTTVRAAPGRLADLLEWYDKVATSGFYRKAGLESPLILRHSQGDQWDLMVISPIDSFAAHFQPDAIKQRQSAIKLHTALLAEYQSMPAFEADHFAYGAPVRNLRLAHAANGLAHIEMFYAAPGKAKELFRQRQMENAYLAATGQTTNFIFRRAAGSDVDVFTIGFHEDMAAFAAPAPATDDDKEAAAVAAGFKDRDDISFYLRSLISSHHDTLAVKVH